MRLGSLIASFVTGLSLNKKSVTIVSSMSKLPDECVWDYPRPAVCEPFEGSLTIEMKNGVSLVEKATSAFRTLETSHPPTYYIHQKDINMNYLHLNERKTMCEWKGQASYFDLLDDSGNIIAQNVAWTYTKPTETFIPIANYISFYAQYFKRCSVNDEEVQPQEGDFYGGWITSNLKGPFKGGPGSWGW